MRKQWTGFLAGFLVAILLSATVTPTLAALAGKTIQVFTGVDVYVNDAKVEPKDANGNPVEVFVYNGTTYLPIRAIGNALGMPVQWEGKTNSAYVGKHQGDKPAVWLKDLDYFTGHYFGSGAAKDNLGIEHQNVVWGESSADKGRYYYGDISNTYLINGQYTAISGTLFQNYSGRSNYTTTRLTIYGDGEQLYQADMRGGIKPIDFYINLNGVLELKIVLEYAAGSYDSGYSGHGAIADCGLWA